MANRKRKPINIDSNQEGEKFDTLFSSKETPIKKISPEQEEVRLQQFDKIRNFFKRDKRQKQYSDRKSVV